MDDYKQIVDAIALSMGAAWASGVNLYAAILVLGLLSITGNIALPETLHVLNEPVVLFAAGFMFMVEFFADKTPGVDTGWDAIHTFIRIPAGAALAAGAVGDVNPAVMVAAGIVGGGVTAATHATKAGSRVLINTSPEPFTNWAASIGEDMAVVAGLWAALHYPLVFICLLIIFLLMLVWLLPKLWRGIKKVFGFLKRLVTGKKEEETPAPTQDAAADAPAETGLEPAEGKESA
ncbi:conserved hypothetical protein [Desulfatibacillum aliphaticivorans]|uniref:DUF4126 domain-containing protein n=1 Tax=Desulfatibacillum aliphaticivorans TaxID=218208 RepID=B8FHN8_DESAL|nr:DUF4126 domain-containing protein [Desulfatibacillum aliphaticivorans]ACL02455.1 conserved hypothetical protein [Desulfatibacillum aliphaticivorans]